MVQVLEKKTENLSKAYEKHTRTTAVRPILAARKLQKTYGKKPAVFTALKNINLEINTGDSVAIIGKSGSGKSTLMHLLALLDEPTEGAVLINDKNARNYSGQQLDKLRNTNFGFVFQQFFLNGNDSVLNNVILPLKIAGVGRKERLEKGMKVLKAVELDDKTKNKANDLSGGQKQRVVIARALINDPEIIFADEPTGNLDSATGKKIVDLLFELNEKQGITLVIVTHDPDRALRCDYEIRIKDGEIAGESK